MAMNKEQQARAKKASDRFADEMYWREKSYIEINKLDEPLRKNGNACLDYYSAIEGSGSYTLAEATTSFLIYIATKTPNASERKERLTSLINKWMTKNDTRAT
jgi:hypothetical protein